MQFDYKYEDVTPPCNALILKCAESVHQKDRGYLERYNSEGQRIY